MPPYFLLLAIGALAGFLAGLLGIGGGFIVVPTLHVLLPHLGIDPSLVPTVAVATSLAAMVPTAAAAGLAQHRRGTLRVAWVRLLAPGAAVGSAVGSLGAASFGGPWLLFFFSAYAAAFASKLLRQSPAANADPESAPRWILKLPQSLVGLVVGLLAALAGVGGASLVMAYLMARSAQLREAAAASSVVGLVIACVGAVAFASCALVPGNAAHATHAGLVGFVCWPAALAIGAAAIGFAPLGVAAAHRLSVRRLRQAFAAMLLTLAGLALARGLA